MKNNKQLSIILLIMLFLHSFAECIAINNIYQCRSQVGLKIERKPKIVVFLKIGTFGLMAYFVIIHKSKNLKKVKKPDDSIVDIKQINENRSDVSIIEYDIVQHGEAIKKIVEQGPDQLDDTPNSSKSKKIFEIMSDLGTIKTTKILINKDNVPIGFINFREKSVGVGYILLLGIDKENQRKGYGQMLLKYAVDEFKKNKGIKNITIDVLSSNTPAKKLYEKLNFVFDESKPIRSGVIQGTYTIN